MTILVTFLSKTSESMFSCTHIDLALIHAAKKRKRVYHMLADAHTNTRYEKFYKEKLAVFVIWNSRLGK